MIRRFLPIIAALVLAAPGRAQTPPDTPQALSLQEARQTALQRHPRVQIADLEARIAGENLRGARAGYFPSADVYADAVQAGNANTRILAGGLNNPVIYDRAADGVGVTQLITDFGRTSNLIAGAKLSARAQAQNAEATRDLILLNVDAAYYRAVEAGAVARVARQTVATQQTLAQQIGALARGRLRSELDVSFAQVGVEQSLLVLQQAEGDEQSAMAALSAAMGYQRPRTFLLDAGAAPAAAQADQSAQASPPATPPGTVDEAIDQAMQSRPDLQRLRLESEAAGHEARAERDRNYPVVSAVGTIGNAITHDNRLPNKYAAGGIELDLPLFEGGAYVARAKAAQLRAQEADQILREAEDDAARDVRVAWIGVRTAQRKVATLEQLVRHANEAYSLAQARYKVGSSSIVELNQAQLNEATAQIQEADARYDALIAQSVLAYQTGRLH